MPLLTWEEANAARPQLLRDALMGFECTARPTKSAETRWKPQHPAIWEYQVQSAIHDFRPPIRRPEHLWLGFDEAGLVAVTHWVEVDGPGWVELLEMAVALRQRGPDSPSVSQEMFDLTLDVITERAIARGDVDEVDILAMVWSDNHGSQRMCRKAGLDVVGEGAPGVQKWGGRLPIRV